MSEVQFLVARYAPVRVATLATPDNVSAPDRSPIFNTGTQFWSRISLPIPHDIFAHPVLHQYDFLPLPQHHHPAGPFLLPRTSICTSWT